jgi:hypothetical protein
VTGTQTRAEQVRDGLMIVITALWIVFGAAFVVQLFQNGAKVLDSLPPFWFWGIPLAPYSALYTPWVRSGNVPTDAANPPPGPPAPPAAPAAPETP